MTDKPRPEKPCIRCGASTTTSYCATCRKLLKAVVFRPPSKPKADWVKNKW